MKIKFWKPATAVVLSALMLLGGCGGVKTEDVKKFAALSTQAGEKFPALAADIPESCIRRSKYQAMRMAQFDAEQLQAKAEQACSRFETLEPRIVGANKVLLEYMNAMGKLSSDEVVTYDKSLDKFADELTAAGDFGEPKVKAVKGIVKFLSNALAGEWRRKKIGAAIQESNPHIQVLTQALSAIVKDDYKNLLDIEEEAARKFYLGNIQDHKATQPLSVVLVHRQWEQERTVIQNKKRAADGYVTILTSIASGHQKIHDNKMNSKEVRKMVLQYASTVEPLIKDLRTAF